MRIALSEGLRCFAIDKHHQISNSVQDLVGIGPCITYDTWSIVYILSCRFLLDSVRYRPRPHSFLGIILLTCTSTLCLVTSTTSIYSTYLPITIKSSVSPQSNARVRAVARGAAWLRFRLFRAVRHVRSVSVFPSYFVFWWEHHTFPVLAFLQSTT